MIESIDSCCLNDRTPSVDRLELFFSKWRTAVEFSHWDANDLYVSLPVKTIGEFVVGLADQNPRDRSIVVALACLFRRNRDKRWNEIYRLRYAYEKWFTYRKRRKAFYLIGISIWRGSIDSSMNEGTQLQRRRDQSSTNELTSISKRKKISVRMVSSRYWRIRSRRLRAE